MKKLLLLLSLLIIPITVYGGMRIINGAILGGTAAEPPATTTTTTAAVVPDLINETFETTPGTDETWATPNTPDGDCTITYDEANPSGSGEVGKIAYATAGANHYRQITATFATQTGATYTRVKMYFENAWSANNQNVDVITIRQSDNQYILRIYARRDSGGNIEMFMSDSQSAVIMQIADQAVGGWYTIIVYYPNDGSPMQYKFNGGEAVPFTSGTPTKNPAKLIFGEYAVSSATNIYIDDVAVSTTAEGVGW